MYFDPKIPISVIGAGAGYIALQKWGTSFQEARDLLQTWRTLNVIIIPDKARALDTLGVPGFDLRVSALQELGFQIVGGYALNVRTEGPLGTSGVVIRSKAIQQPPLASPVEALPPQGPLKPYRIAMCLVLAHAEYKCQAVVSISGQAEYSGSPLQLGFTGNFCDVIVRITSIGGNFECVTSSEISVVSSLWDKPGSFVTRYAKMGCAPLLQNHLQERDNLARSHNLEWEVPVSVDTILEQEETKVAQIKEWSQRHSALQLTFMLSRLKRAQKKAAS